jgi:hypothetical protein
VPADVDAAAVHRDGLRVAVERRGPARCAAERVGVGPAALAAGGGVDAGAVGGDRVRDDRGLGFEAGHDLALGGVEGDQAVVSAGAVDLVELAADVDAAAGGGDRFDLVVGGGLPGGVEGAGGEVEGGEPGAGLPVDGGDGAADVQAAAVGGDGVRLAADAVLEGAGDGAGGGVEPGEAVPLLPADGGEVAGGVDGGPADREGFDATVGGGRPGQQLAGARVDGGEPVAGDGLAGDDDGEEVAADVHGVAGVGDGEHSAVEAGEAVRFGGERGVGRGWCGGDHRANDRRARDDALDVPIERFAPVSHEGNVTPARWLT